MKPAEKKKGTGYLSVPASLLDAAGIPRDSDLTVETLPGVLLIGRQEPVKTAMHPILELLEELGIPFEEVRQALEDGGVYEEETDL